MKEYYVILTGSKNNAGDYLIKHRAEKLLEKLRSDREVIEYNAWEPLTNEKLSIVNESKCLILLGGPALQRHMYPGIYPLVPNLNSIKCPITTLGIGWKSTNGNWVDSYDYPLNKSSLTLLNKINASGLAMSVRDYHTKNALLFKGYNNVVMTGCTAYYDLDAINKDYLLPNKFENIAFSLGVSFINSPSMEALMKKQILSVKDYFPDSSFTVVFHHSLDREKYLKTHGSKPRHNKKHRLFAKWLSENHINYTDISGSAESLIEFYTQVDFHIGFRVHAHIFMSSIGKPTLLISEDGRAKGSYSAIGGMVVDGYKKYKENRLFSSVSMLSPLKDRYISNEHSVVEILDLIDYEINTEGQRGKNSHHAIAENYNVMHKFITELP